MKYPDLLLRYSEPAAVAAYHSDGEWRRAKHLNFLSRHLAKCLYSRQRLIITMPVRHGKSELCSIWTPIWWLLTQPVDGRVLIASHGAELATEFGRQIRDHTKNPDLPLFLREDQRAAGSWRLASGGRLHTAGVGGSITGRGFNLIVVDDSIKDMETAYSATHRDIVWRWFTGTLNSRLQPGGSIVVIQSRWHEDDLVGRLQGDEYESEIYDAIDLPAIATGVDAIGREQGEALWPEEWPLEELALRRTAVGPTIWQAQYQGSPTTPEGNVFLREWWRYIDVVDVPPADVDLRIWDLGYTENGGDWTCGVRMQYTYKTGQIVISDVARFRHSSGRRDARIRETAERDGQGVIIGLPGDLGQIEHFRDHVLQGYMIEEVSESTDKLVRALKSGYPARVERRDVYLVRAGWNAAFVNEHADFPGGRHDDQVDPSANGYSVITDPRFAPLAFA